MVKRHVNTFKRMPNHALVRLRHQTNVAHKIYTMGLMTPYGDTLFIPIVLYTLRQQAKHATCILIPKMKPYDINIHKTT